MKYLFRTINPKGLLKDVAKVLVDSVFGRENFRGQCTNPICFQSLLWRICFASGHSQPHFSMAYDGDANPSGFYFLASAASFAVSGVSGLVSYYQRQQLKALESAIVVKVRAPSLLSDLFIPAQESLSVRLGR